MYENKLNSQFYNQTIREKFPSHQSEVYLFEILLKHALEPSKNFHFLFIFSCEFLKLFRPRFQHFTIVHDFKCHNKTENSLVKRSSNNLLKQTFDKIHVDSLFFCCVLVFFFYFGNERKSLIIYVKV